MPTNKTYKIGTRGSLLALTQCQQVKEQLEKLTGDQFVLEIIKTQGDVITNAPLWQLDGKDFFSKELDEALQNNRVDLVVHSLKDLGSQRPENIELAAITKRSLAQDILLIKNTTISSLRSRDELIVGTSSPRRITNIEKELLAFLPCQKNLKVKTKILRGNVNSRISKLNNDEYDAIVIALAGLERLSDSENSKKELQELVSGLNFMILPQSYFTSASSQGALGIECLKHRQDGGELLAKLKLLEDQTTKEEVQRERLAFSKYGGGCHLPVGINVRKIKNFYVHRHLGELNQNAIKKFFLEGRTLPNAPQSKKIFNGHYPNDKYLIKNPIEVDISSHSNIYVTSRHCLHAVKKNPSTLWAAGPKTMKDLANRGFWVNGCSDSLGDEVIEELFNSKFVNLLKKDKSTLVVLSHTGSNSNLGPVEKCYERRLNSDIKEDFINEINETQVFYWTSFYQYEVYVEKFPEIKNRTHACGLGKTYHQFVEKNIPVIPFSSMEEFKKWIEND